MKRMRVFFLFAAGILLSAATSAHAETYEIQAGNFNSTFMLPLTAPEGGNKLLVPPTLNSNFLGMGPVAGSAGPVDSTPNVANDGAAISGIYADRYPSNTANTLVLARSSVAGVFSSGVPRFYLGDEITPPLVNAAGGTFPGATDAAKLAAARLYWRPSPAMPGETFPGLGVPGLPLGSATVTAADTNTTVITVAATPVPLYMTVGATLLGQPITKITGTNPFIVTLAGKANETISGSTARTITPALPFYYSRHAERVFASQPGQTTVTWVTVALNAIKTETFIVASATQRPVRTIYWTEGSFDGPKVQITDARITTVNPVYYSAVPKAVPAEVIIPGYTPPAPNLSTLYFDKFNGNGILHAYNVEGRILIEYLGNVRVGDTYESLGTDVVEIMRAPVVYQSAQNLGTELVPRVPVEEGDDLLVASPVQSSAQGAVSYYGTRVGADGAISYFAERETSPANDPDNGEPGSSNAYNRVVFYWMESPPDNFNIKWPKFQSRYWQRWSPNLADYAHYSVSAAGSTTDTGVSFAGAALPALVWQDDPAQAEAAIDVATQRLFVTFAPTNVKKRNRSLLKFTSGNDVWYVNLYTQAETRQTTRTATANNTTTVTLSNGGSTAGLEAGMVVTGTGIAGGTATIVSITDNTHLILSATASTNTTFTFTVESDSGAPINPVNGAAATVGTRIDPPAQHEIAGYISGGKCYYPGGYRNPFTFGVEAANLGAIIPVNARTAPGNVDNLLTVRWFRKFSDPDDRFPALYVPGKIGRYTVTYPATPPRQIVIAEGIGTGALPPDVAAGAIYYQNIKNDPGYNPNEEHALMIGNRAYALRDDLNMIAPAAHSQPYVLIGYTSAADLRPAMQIYKVVREVDPDPLVDEPGDILFDRPAVAGTLLVAPYPLPDMPLPFNAAGVCQNAEVTPAAVDPRTNTSAPSTWNSFTFKDRKGFHWVFRGPHDGVTATSKQIAMQYKYVSRPGFFLPFPNGAGRDLAVGSLQPFLRPLNATTGVPQGDAEIGAPLTINFIPAWPANAPELRVGESLTLPKFGLPQVRGQKSANVFYEQSLALLAPAKPSVMLHDPTREKTIRLKDKGFDALPVSIATTSSFGKLYFQGLSPDLQQRIWFDPLRGGGVDAAGNQLRPGAVVLVGQFKDEIAGEDYLHLNALTDAQIKQLNNLCPPNDSDRIKWESVITGLITKVETYIEDPQRLGTYKVGSTATVPYNQLAKITNSDTAVDSYALTATGEGSGWVTMVFGNGKAPFTPQGDPVQVKVLKVVPRLYTGELKVLYSSNPLDEQVSLRHTGDFANRPQDYEFEWKWAPDTGTAPATYTTSWRPTYGITSANNLWTVVRNPAGALPTDAEWAAALVATPPQTSLPLPRSFAIRNSAYAYDPAKQNPGLVLRNNSFLNFSSTGIPGELVFSASMGALDGFVLYINGNPAIANLAPEGFVNNDAVTGLVPGNTLQRQFRVPRSFFTAGPNDFEIALFTGADVNAQSSFNFRLDVTVEADVTVSTFQPVSDPLGNNTNVALVGGDPSLPFGGSAFVLNDRWFTMRYRPKPGVTNVAGTGFSRWMPPQFVEGWIKRVLRDINPFEQRVKDLFNNAINTDTSVLTQAGTRWEGDVALTLDNIESVGLIAIYETVLNRARSMSIDANTNDPGTNNALMLAAGYLSDLYSLLGNEAYADGANPTISTDDPDETTEINTSRFSFENQVRSSLEEELALLRGRDASGTRVDVSPAYNRLYWNFTGGINAGEALYATNYNIKEKAGSSTADGVLDAADAQRMFPQGHGDAYGHYLTALTGYYRLLANPNFLWQRRAEAVLVLGQAVTVDFVDERKFAGNASNIARTAQQICDLTMRQQYQEGAPGWSQYRDTATAPNTVEERNWGLDEWTSRSTQGAYYHWLVGNAMLPDVDNQNTGVEKIDRTTVPELNELATALTSFQTTVDNTSARLNPLGLSVGAIQFDIDSTFLEVGSTAGIGDNAVQGMGHFDQIRERAMKTVVNAAGAFQQAARMTRSLRTQENVMDDYNSNIVDQERTFRNQLIEIYGRPYEGAVGPGKSYAQGYYGPDLSQWFVVDRPNNLVDTTVADTVKFRIWMVTDREFKIPSLDGDGIIRDYDVYSENGNPVRREVEVTAYPNQFIQYSDVWLPGLGKRPETGELQGALLDAHRSFLVLKDGLYNVKVLQHKFLREGNLLKEALQAHGQHLGAQDASRLAILILMKLQKTLESAAEGFSVTADGIESTVMALKEFMPLINGIDNDYTSAARGAVLAAGVIDFIYLKAASVSSGAGARLLDVDITDEEMSLERTLDAIGFSLEEKQQAYELENLYRDLTTQEYALAHPLAAYQAANERVLSVLARGQRLQEERDAFRKRAASVVQGYRTKDVTFRVFRNEALEQYRSLFNLASRYTYMAAKAYDYETGLLGTTEGQAFISSIVASRSLGDVRDGDVFATVSSLGDNGLAGAMAKMHADHEVAEGRLGINNPEIYSTLFSLRGENFRIRDVPGPGSDDEAWQQTLEQFFKANIMTDPDVAASCRNVKKPDGSPVPGIIIPFSTTIKHGLNFFGRPLAPGDHNFTASNYSTKIQSLGIALPGYVGMDEYASGDPDDDHTPALDDPDALAATPWLYVIPTGSDYMYAPPLGNELFERSWLVEDQAIPLPFNIGANAFNSTQIFNANGTLSEKPWVVRQHQAFRPVADPSILLGGLPTEFTSHRLVGRSVWNSGWKIVIPAYTLLNNEQEGLNRFARTVRDISIFIRSYSYSGN